MKLGEAPRRVDEFRATLVGSRNYREGSDCLGIMLLFFFYGDDDIAIVEDDDEVGDK